VKTPRAAWSECRAWLATAGTVLVLFGLWFRSAYQLGVVSGDSMLPTLRSGSLLLIDKRAYEQVKPNRGDIVVARYAGGLVVKRVVGLPGEEVEVQRGRLYVNGTRVQESHAINPGDLFIGEGKMLPADFATLGDNRAVSPGTAVHPIITKADIVGKVVFILQMKIP
jgi:signal peptidase I